MGVRVNRNSVEKVPPRKLSDYVLRALPGTPTGIGVQLNIQHQLGISFRQVQGAAIKLVKDQKARWRGPTLVGIPA